MRLAHIGESGKRGWMRVLWVLVLGLCSGRGQSPPLPTAPTFQCSGSVVDVHAQPINGARIECYQVPGEALLSSDAPVLEHLATTDTQGHFKFSVSYSAKILLAQKAGFAPTWTCAAEPGEREWRLVLPPQGQFSGIVLDKNKRPVADAEVWAAWVLNQRTAAGGRFWQSFLSGPLARKLFSARTSADGSFRISGFPTEASALLAARKPGLASPPTSSSSESWFAGGVSGRSGQHDIQITVEPTGSIEGRVTVGGTDPFFGVETKGGVRKRVPHPGEPGQPVAKAKVVLIPVAETWAEAVQLATTSGDGVFHFPDVAAGQYRLTDASESALAPELMTLNTSCYLKAGEAVTNLVLRAAPAGTLVVNVRSSADSKPIPGATLSLNQQHFTCDFNGQITLRQPAGDCQVHVQKPRFQENGFHTNIYAGQTTKVEFALVPLPKISGLVLSPAGKPAAWTQVTAFITEPNPDFKTESTEDGTFELPWHPNWDKLVRPCSGVIVRDLTNGLVAYVPLLAGKRQLMINLAPGLKISGSVTDKQNRPLPYIPVAACLRDMRGPMGVQFSTETGADGRFVINALPRGHTYDILPLIPGNRDTPLRVPPTQTNDIELVPISIDSQPQIR